MSVVKEKLIDYISSGDIDRAYELIESNLHGEINNLKNDPEYCILSSTAYLQKGNLSRAYDLISLGLLSDNHNYELYLILGEYYSHINVSQALICYYQALFYCTNEEDKNIIENYIIDIVSQGAYVRQVSFVLVTKDQSEELKRCLNSIISTVPTNLFEIVIVDNASTDDTSKWAPEIEGITYWHSEDHIRYSQVVNQGFRLAENFNDVFLLDADCVLADNSLFYLMLGLYSDDGIGVIGGITNDFVIDQKMYIDTSDFENALKLAASVNSPMAGAYEKEIYVSDHAMLIKREAIDKVGFFDERFQTDNYEDKDFCVRVISAELSVILCFNSYIFKFSDRHKKYGASDALIGMDKQAFHRKWNFNIDYSNNARDGIIDMIQAEKSKPVEVLELGCAMGSTLNRIKRNWPNAKAYGVEYDDAVVRVAEKMGNIIQGDVETMEIPYRIGQFDYIICADVLEHLRNPKDALKRFIPFLKDDGCFLISLPNVRHYGVIMMLALEGRFDYAADGILDSTHLRFFTRDNAKEMIESAGLQVLDIRRNYNGHPEDNEYITKLTQSFNVQDPEELKVFQYYFMAKKNDG